MKRTLTLLCAIAIAGSAVAKDANAEFKAFMKSMLPKIEKAFANKDIKFFESISTADFTETMMGKTYSKKQALSEIAQSFKMGSTKMSLSLLSATVKGNTAIALTHGKGTMTMAPPKKGVKAMTTKIEMWERETWVRVGKGWKIKHLEEAKPMRVDGKVVNGG